MQNEKGHVFTLTGRKRGNTTYCAEKNTPFQGLAADGAKLAMYELCKEGFTITGFVHDEIICEVPEENVEELKNKMEEIMIKGMKKVVPDVAVGVESEVSKYYTK
jgi:DNA polymerase I-like protein with 3'-5' exonuclease and polymerase domains